MKLISLLKILIVTMFLSSCNDQIAPQVTLNEEWYNVGFLVMDGVYNTELTAPYDIFQHTQFREGIKAMNVFIIADTNDPIRTFEGMRILPDFNYINDELPKIDILVVPSAEHHLDSDLENEVLINFVKKVGDEATFITSHCDGAFVLAQVPPCMAISGVRLSY